MKEEDAMGCSTEFEAGKYVTPGSKLQDNDTIENDSRGLKRMFSIKRFKKCFKTQPLVSKQTSLYCLQSWHANCNISVLI